MPKKSRQPIRVLNEKTERVVVDPSIFRNCEDSIGHICRNRSKNPPTYPPTQKSSQKTPQQSQLKLKNTAQ